MKKQRGFKTLKGKILAGFMVVVLLSVALAGSMMVMMYITNKETEQMIEKELPNLIINEQLAINMHEGNNLLNAYVLYNDYRYRDQFDEGIEESIALENKALELSDQENLAGLMTLKVEWGRRTGEALALYDAGEIDQTVLYLQNQVAPLAFDLVNQFTALASESEARIETLGQELLTLGDMMMFASALTAVAIIVVALLIAFLMSASISKPIKKVTERMTLLREGHLSAEPLETKFRDETGQLMLATNDLNQQMHGLISQLSDVAMTVETHSIGLTQSAEELTTGADQIAVTMSELADGSEQQATHATDLSEGMQAFNIEMLAAMNQGNAANKETQNVLKMSAEGQASIKASVQMMRDIDQVIKTTVERVKTLDQDAQRISKMVAVIEDIADQTNLLALNASIEAARAGEHGKGFAVVANEVRKLAEQVSRSVNEITDTVQTIQSSSNQVNQDLTESYDAVQKGTTQIKATRETFEAINQAVTTVATGIDSIADTLMLATGQTEKLLVSVEEVASISEESAAGVEETSASVEEMNGSMITMASGANDLTTLVVRLKTIVDRFKI